MERWVLIVVIVGVSICIISSAFVILYFYKKNQMVEKEVDAGFQMADAVQPNHTQSRRWGQIITLYLLLCAIFIGIISYQSIQGMEERASHCLGVLVGAVFFMIQAVTKRSVAKRRERAVAHTIATLVATGSSMGLEPGHSSYHSIYEFSVDGVTQRVKSPGICGVEKGEQVDLYYVPHYPKMFYIPRVEESHKGWEVLLYAIGIGFPLLMLIIPLFGW